MAIQPSVGDSHHQEGITECATRANLWAERVLMMKSTWLGFFRSLGPLSITASRPVSKVIIFISVTAKMKGGSWRSGGWQHVLSYTIE